MAIFIAILGLVPLSSGFSLIVVMVLYIERELVHFIDGFVLIVEGFGLFLTNSKSEVPSWDSSPNFGLGVFFRNSFSNHPPTPPGKSS